MKEKFLNWLNDLWPISSQELKKLLPMTLLLFFLCVNSSILRNLKDAVTLTGNPAGAEVIPFIKVWGMLPSAALLTWLFTKLSRKVGRDKTFYLFITGFLSFYLLFAFFIYPYKEFFYLEQLSQSLTTLLPEGARGFIGMVAHWERRCCINNH